MSTETQKIFSSKKIMEKESTFLPKKDSKNGSQQSKDITTSLKYSKRVKNPHVLLFNQQALKLDFFPMDSRENFQGNYEEYLSVTLQHISRMQKILNYDYALESPFLFKGIPSLFNSRETENSAKKKLLFLDLDETLVHSDFNEEYLNHKTIKYDTFIEFEDKPYYNDDEFTSIDEEDEENFSNQTDDEMCTVGVFLRNGAKEFLAEASKYFDIGIFTASVKEYADAVINYLDPEQKYIKFRLYRNNCININNLFNVKDLRVIKNIDLKNTIIVDNSIYSFAPQLTNGILINSFYADKNDKELYNLLNYLINYILPSKDVREVNEQFFNFQTLVNELSNSNN